MWSTIFVSSILTEIWQTYLINQNCIIFKIQERYIYQVKQFMKSSSDVQSRFFYFLCHALNIRNQRRLSSCLLIPMFIKTPCILSNDPKYPRTGLLLPFIRMLSSVFHVIYREDLFWLL